MKAKNAWLCGNWISSKKVISVKNVIKTIFFAFPSFLFESEHETTKEAESPGVLTVLIND